MVSKKLERQLKVAVGALTVLGMALAPWVTWGMDQTTLVATIFLSISSIIGGLAQWANRELSDLVDEKNGIKRVDTYGHFLAPVVLPALPSITKSSFAHTTEVPNTLDEVDGEVDNVSVTDCEAMTSKTHYSKKDKKS
jgi:hypothetical protein